MADTLADRDLQRTSIDGVFLVKRTCYEDERGFLCRVYSADLFKRAGIEKPVVQVNHTLTRKTGAVRGMHFQRPPHAEVKLVSCLRGEVFDVAVDLRRRSSTFLKWHAEVISAATRSAMLIPEGVAHGFQTLTEDCELLYLHSAGYAPDAEGGVSPLDPLIGVRWPLEIAQLSDRDRGHALLSTAFEGIDL
jgi:dTDP-4-dehydrorhamnose 3,5-epimerase